MGTFTDVHYVKNKFTQKAKFSHYLLTVLLMGSWVKFCGPQNISGASQQSSNAEHQLLNRYLIKYIINTFFKAGFISLAAEQQA